LTWRSGELGEIAGKVLGRGGRTTVAGREHAAAPPMAIQQQVLRARDGRPVQSPQQLAGLIEKIGAASVGLSHKASVPFRGILVRFHRK
jgi:hypothetical protein